MYNVAEDFNWQKTADFYSYLRCLVAPAAVPVSAVGEAWSRPQKNAICAGMNTPPSTQKLPTSRPELFALLELCVAVKKKLVQFVTENYAHEVRKELFSISGKSTTQYHYQHAVETVIDEHHDPDGITVIDAFISASKLTPRETEIVSAWRGSTWGIFHLGESDGPIADSVNLIDSLPYRLVSNNNTGEVRRSLRSRGFLFSKIVPLFDAWMLSGSTHLLNASEKRVAYGMAAETAQKTPRLFFRNPDNLNRALAREHENHREFVEHFGAPWVMGAPKDIENRGRQFLMRKLDAEAAERASTMFALPSRLHSAKTVGMIHNPADGLYFLEDFGVFLDALHNPAKIENQSVRELLMGYLESPGVSPAIFSLVARERPDALCKLLARLLDRPDFDWDRDWEACLREHNPEFFKLPRFPSTIPMNDDLIDGLKYLRQRDKERDASQREEEERMLMDDELTEDDESLAIKVKQSARIAAARKTKSKADRKQSRKARRQNKK